MWPGSPVPWYITVTRVRRCWFRPGALLYMEHLLIYIYAYSSFGAATAVAAAAAVDCVGKRHELSKRISYSSRVTEKFNIPPRST